MSPQNRAHALQVIARATPAREIPYNISDLARIVSGLPPDEAYREIKNFMAQHLSIARLRLESGLESSKDPAEILRAVEILRQYAITVGAPFSEDRDPHK